MLKKSGACQLHCLSCKDETRFWGELFKITLLQTFHCPVSQDKSATIWVKKLQKRLRRSWSSHGNDEQLEKWPQNRCTTSGDRSTSGDHGGCNKNSAALDHFRITFFLKGRYNIDTVEHVYLHFRYNDVLPTTDGSSLGSSWWTWLEKHWVGRRCFDAKNGAGERAWQVGCDNLHPQIMVDCLIIMGNPGTCTNCTPTMNGGSKSKWLMKIWGILVSTYFCITAQSFGMTNSMWNISCPQFGRLVRARWKHRVSCVAIRHPGHPGHPTKFQTPNLSWDGRGTRILQIRVWGGIVWICRWRPSGF